MLTSAKDAVNQSSINQKDVKNFHIIVPPIDLQRRFAAIVESIEQQKARLRAHLAELDTLFASLQQRAFNGEL
ncbi:MAG: restriction endonuclease subunit S [Planctomycetes bacterium]|nr:restriction endonuclease subunit S [Planctomycetota bacterium]